MKDQWWTAESLKDLYKKLKTRVKLVLTNWITIMTLDPTAKCDFEITLVTPSYKFIILRKLS